MSSRDDRARIKRGGKPRKPATVRKTVPARRKAAQPSTLSTALALIPSPAIVWAKRAANWALIAGALGLVGTGLVAAKLPQMIGIEIGEGIGQAGFSVDRIEIKGIKHMERDQVLAAALNEQSRAMPLVGLEDIRAKIMQLGWVEEARVSRRLPDTLVIDIVERAPAAIWQYQQRLALVDANGRVIERVKLTGTPLPDLPIVIGPNANLQLGQLKRLLRAVPALDPMLDGATWVGDRRWDIRFRSGETLLLPEGEADARAALLRFAREDGKARLLGQGAIRFDMRVPGRLVVRVPSAEQRRAQAIKQQEQRDDAAHDPATAENT